MTVSTTVTKVIYNGDGSTTAFPTTFEFFDAADIEVIERVIATGAETVKALTTDYTVSGGDGSTGTVTAVTAPAAPVQWVIRRVTPLTQLIDYVENDAFPAETHEKGLDLAVMRAQERSEELARAPKFAVSDPAASLGDIPNSTVRASNFLAFDADGVPIAAAGSVDQVPTTAYTKTLLDDADAAAARATLELGTAATQGSASETAEGIAEIATQAETDAGTDDARIVTPLKLAGRALVQGKHTIWVPAAAMRPRVSNGSATIASVETTAGNPDYHALDFDTAAEEHAQFSITMPKSWDESTVTFRTHHTHAGGQTAGLDGVTWAAKAVAVGHDDLIDAAFGTAVNVTVDHATAEDEMISAESAPLTVGGTPAASDRVIFDIGRIVADAGDDLDIDARLLGVEILLTLNAGNDA